jgi:glycine/D-amino acid oxidase-like deaminating enzyme
LRVAIAGAGVFGLSAACELAGRGHDVVVYEDDRNLPAIRAASRDVSKALRHEYGRETPLYAPWVSRARELWLDLERECGERIFHGTGFLSVTTGLYGAGSFEYDSFRTLSALGHPVQFWSPEEVAERFPGFDYEGIVAATFNPDGGWLDPMTAIPALSARAENRGARIDLGRRLDSCRVEGADAVLLANGVWLDRFFNELELPMTATRQYEGFFRPVNPIEEESFNRPVWCWDIEAEGYYGFPMHPTGGTLKAARHLPGPKVDAEDGRGPDAALHREVDAFVRRRIPGVAKAEDGRCCFYANAPDGRFVFDRFPGKDGVFVAGCGGGHAFKFGPLLGEWAADLIEGSGPPEIFLWKESRRTHEADRL